MDRKYNILFLCTGNSARSIIAEAIMNRVGGERFNAYSAGSHPKGQVHPEALALLKRLDHPTEGLCPKPWDEFAAPGAPSLDFVITVCDSAAGEVCPIWPGQPMTAHWGMPDPPAVEGSQAEIALAFADTYRMLNNRLSAFANLKMSGLDRLSLQTKVRGIPRLKSVKPQAVVSEGLGTALLLSTVVGSGIMAERLAGGNQAIVLLGNAIPTGAMLVVLILVFGPISGAHFNPLVTLTFLWRGEARRAEALTYIPAQIMGAVLGVWLAHLMFDEPLLQVSFKARAGFGQLVSEFMATFGLIATILGVAHKRADTVPWAVGLYIIAAYWFTASTSFANPAVTMARALTNSFSGIAPANVLPFIAAQAAGTAAAAGLFDWLHQKEKTAI